MNIDENVVESIVKRVVSQLTEHGDRFRPDLPVRRGLGCI